MIDKELSISFDRFKKKQEFSKKDSKRIMYYINKIGSIILLFSVIPIIPIILEEAFEISFILSYVIGLIFGIILVKVSNHIGSPWPPRLSLIEKNFIIIIESLECIKEYYENGVEFSRVGAARKLSKVERQLNGPTNDYRFWGALMKEDIDCLSQLKLNFRNRLIPNLIRGDDEDLNQVYLILKKFAKYLLNPTISQLKELNVHISKLNTYPPKESQLKTIFRHTYLQHFYVLIILSSAGYFVFNIGLIIGASIDNAYLAGVGSFGTILTMYFYYFMHNKI